MNADDCDERARWRKVKVPGHAAEVLKAAKAAGRPGFPPMDSTLAMLLLEAGGVR